ncbi:hypothetical protein [Colwellia piezophila]|uniref:hypothetical protein n=1 Tax=Colwellia piezophila TaxID=211668 RepID=UPI00036CE2BE|nr:hypothetical protein [Colwellia piezophila]
MAKYIYFVHGYSSNSEKAWGKFPEYIKNIFGDKYLIQCLDYVSPNKLKFWKHAPSHLNIAEGFITDLRNKCENLSVDEIILVAHSNGGIVVKKLLQQMELHSIKHNITKICFLDVPHTGTGWANFGKIINPLNKHVGALKSNSDSLCEINLRWIKEDHESKIRILNLVAAVEDVVSRSSSSFHYQDTVTIPNVDHAGIAKPDDQNDNVVSELSKFIISSINLDKYMTRASRTYRNWRKIDRHHKLEYVEDEQRMLALQGLQSSFESDKPLVRLTGLSGLGKSRLIVEFIDKHEIPEDLVLIFNASFSQESLIEKLILACDDQLDALVIIENCSVNLHNQIAKVFSEPHNLKIVTVDFYHDKIQSSAHIKLEKLSIDKVKELVVQLLPNANQNYVNRISNFVEGFPLLVDMLIENFRSSGELSAEFTEDDLIEKLINGDNTLTEKQRELLRVMSLFDSFRCEKGINDEENKDKLLINKVAESTGIDFDTVITKFSEKQLINVTGRFARIVPKPLAVNLAMEWWKHSLFERQSELIAGLHETIIDSFCKQIVFLDSSINVQDFVKNFCEGGSPLAQAELLLSKAGSRLFRALVEVNPNETSVLLYRILSTLSDDEISNIDGDVRRNFVWSLEMLVFHQAYFEKASWCLFKLAQFENESYGNNSSGQFSQLFRWQLSGTEADFSQRIMILNKASALNIFTADIVIIEAIKTAIDTHGGSRSIGAEFQGTKPELKEWMPKKWQEIYDYWQLLLDILVVIIKRGQLVEQVKDAFGHNIRGLIKYKQFEQLDVFIKEVIELTGKYWPAAAQSITHALQYDHKGMEDDQVKYLRSWEELLSPDDDNLEEKLQLIVLNPSREHEEDDDGHYIDMAAEDAKRLSLELKDSHTELIEYIQLLTTFPEQKQSWVFAKHLVLDSDNIDELLKAILNYLREHKQLNTQFFSGFLVGLYQKSPEEWKDTIELIGSDEYLIEYYPDAIRTGAFVNYHLDNFIELIRSGKLPSHSASILVYGRATEHLSESEIAQFCMSLSEIDSTAAWAALDNVFMYVHGRTNYNLELLTPVFAHLVLSVSFNKEDKSRNSDSYRWLNIVERLLKTEDEKFSMKLCNYLIAQVGGYEVDYSDLWDYLATAFYKAFELHGNFLWPKVANKFIDGSALKQYRLIGLLGRGKSYKKRTNSVFDLLEPKRVLEWCCDEVALIIVGRAISMFISNDDNRVINPLMVSLLSEFGDNKDFVSEISANFSSRSWSGSLVPYLEADKELIHPLMEHENSKVKSWASNFVEYIDSQIEYEMKQNAEENMLRG